MSKTSVHKPNLVAVPRQISSSARCMNTAAVCEFLGNISVSTLERLIEDPDENFPIPFRMRTNKYWTLGSIEAYVRRKQETTEKENPR